MTAIDDLIVAMGFDNRQFEAAVRVSLDTLSRLKTNLDFSKNDGFSAIEAGADGNASALLNMGFAVEEVGNQFSVMSAIGFSALQRLTNAVIDFGTQTVKGALGGGLGRALKLEQARFQFEGLGQDVEASMDSALAAVDGTAYGLDAAAAVASQFGATGMEAGDEMTNALRGVAGMAGMTGTSFEEIGHIFTTVAGEGKLSTMRMQQFATRGVNVAAKLAEQMGKTEEEVRKMVTNGEIDFKTFAGYMDDAFGEHAKKANETYTGSLSNLNAALSRVGASFHVPRLEAMRKIFNALTGVINDVAKGLEPLVERFTEFMEIKSDNLVNFIEGIDLSGMAKVVEPLANGLFNIFEAASQVVSVLTGAFKDIFLSTPIGDMANSFESFTEKLKMSEETAEKLRSTFKGVFAIFSIAGTIIRHVVGTLFSLFGAVSSGTGGFLDMTASVGDWLASVDKTLKEGSALSSFFEALGNILAVPVKMFSALAGAAFSVIGALSKVGQAAAVTFSILSKGEFKGGLWDEDSGIVKTLFKIRDGLEWIGSAASQMWNALFRGKDIGGVLGDNSPLVNGLMQVRDMIKDFFTPGNITALLGAGGAVALGIGLKNMLKKAFSMFGSDDSESLLGSLKGMFQSIRTSFSGLSGVFDGLTGSLQAMQQNLKASVLLKIAAAVGILALSLKILASIDAADLAKALSAMTVAFTELLGAMAILTKLAGTGGFAQIPAIAAAMAILSVAVLILATAMKVLSTMDWNELSRGLVGLAGIIALVIAASYGLDKVGGPLMRTSASLILFATAARILASAVTKMADLSWADMSKGLVGLAGALAAVAGAMHIMPKGMVTKGAGLIAISAGLMVISTAIKSLGSIDVKDLAQGVLGIGAALAIMGGALHLFPKSLIAQSAGILTVSIALNAMAGAVKSFGGMSVEELAKGLVGLGGALGILAIGLNFMAGSLAGAAALTVAGMALAILVPPLMMLAFLSWDELLMGLGALAGIFVVMGGAALLLGPLVPIIVALSAALLAFGAGMALVGVGMLAFGAGFSMIAAAAMVGKEALLSFIGLLPQIATAFANALAAFVVAIAKNTGQIISAFTQLGVALIDVAISLIPKIGELITTLMHTIADIIIENAPVIAEVFQTLFDTFLEIIVTNAPALYEALLEIMLGFLEVIRDKIPEFAEAVTGIITTFLEVLAENIDTVTNAAFDFIVEVMTTLADTIRERIPEVSEAATEIGVAIIDGLVQAIKDFGHKVKDTLTGMVSGAVDGVLGFLGIKSPSRLFIKIGEDVVDGLIIGLEKGQNKARKTGEKLANGIFHGFTKGVGKEVPKAIDSIFTSLETGAADVQFWGPNSPATAQLGQMSKDLWEVELQLAEFYGEVDRADPASIEAYTEKAGNSFKYLAGTLDALRMSADAAFGALAEGKGLDAALGSEDFLGGLLNAGLSLLPGVEAMGIKLGLAVVDGLLGVFVGEGTTVLGTIGKFITKAIRKVGGWFGIKFPIEEEAKEGAAALDDFLVKVDGAHARFEKVAEDEVKELGATIDKAKQMADELDGLDPTITPIIDMDKFHEDLTRMQRDLYNSEFDVDASARQASNLMYAQQDLDPSETDPRAHIGSTTLEFNQYNNSPKALSHVELYRQTKSQIALAKEELGV